MGVRYTLRVDGTASAKVDDKNIERLTIPEFVMKDGKNMKLQQMAVADPRFTVSFLDIVIRR